MAPAWPAGRPSGRFRASGANPGKGYHNSRSESREVPVPPPPPPVREASRSDWNEWSRICGSSSPVCTPARGLPQSPGSRSSASTADTAEWTPSFAQQARQRFPSDSSTETMAPPPGNWLPQTNSSAKAQPRVEVSVLATSPTKQQQLSYSPMLAPTLPFAMHGSLLPAGVALADALPSLNLPRSAPPSGPPAMPLFRDAPRMPPPPGQGPVQQLPYREETPPPPLHPARMHASSRAQSPALAWEVGEEPASLGACGSASTSPTSDEATSFQHGFKDLWIMPPKALGGGASLWQMPSSPSKAAVKQAARGGDFQSGEVYLIVVNPSNGMLDAFEVPEPCEAESSAQRSRSSPAALSGCRGQRRCSDRFATSPATSLAKKMACWQESMKDPCPTLLGGPRRLHLDLADRGVTDCSEV
mmetsp:Transcript_85883/g.152118  ORF Transcript_85883/g.152118 Transcript_85883/m.152118 type:complete len:416 (-) Transcript_85883:61-1308(-)